MLYTNNGSDNPPAVLGNLSVLPSAISYADGFFLFPTQVLARATGAEPGGVTTAFVEGQSLGAYTSFVDLANAAPDFKRQILISGGFLNNMASASDPKAFEPPTRRGFGGRIIEQMIAQLKGDTRFDWRAEGVVCEITLQV